MKKRSKPPIAALYAAPGFFTKDEYPENNKRPDPADERNFMAVYAGPDFFTGAKEYPVSLSEDDPSRPDPAMRKVYAGPDPLAGKEGKKGRPEAEILDVYAGPVPEEEPEAESGEAPAMNKGAEILGVYAGPAPVCAQDETDEEIMERLMKQLEKDPPMMQGLVQASPTPPSPLGMGMMGGLAGMRFCPECGTKAVPGDKFCRECGTSLTR